MKEEIIECSEQTVLKCSCGEQLVLLGHREDWHQEKRLTFTCGCGEQVSLTSQLGQVVYLRKVVNS